MWATLPFELSCGMGAHSRQVSKWPCRHGNPVVDGADAARAARLVESAEESEAPRDVRRGLGRCHRVAVVLADGVFPLRHIVAKPRPVHATPYERSNAAHTQHRVALAGAGL